MECVHQLLRTSADQTPHPSTYRLSRVIDLRLSLRPESSGGPEISLVWLRAGRIVFWAPGAGILVPQSLRDFAAPRFRPLARVMATLRARLLSPFPYEYGHSLILEKNNVKGFGDDTGSRNACPRRLYSLAHCFQLRAQAPSLHSLWAGSRACFVGNIDVDSFAIWGMLALSQAQG